MLIGIPKETDAGENRVPLLPDGVKKLVAANATVAVESGLGDSLRIPDQAYLDAGASLAERSQLLATADVLLRLRKPALAEVAQMKRGAIHISFLDPFNEQALVDALAAQGVTALSMEMIPRITRSQKMDALSSQANLAGYAMVLLAAERLDRILPMMMTPAGTITPARVFVIGAGVAGLQAIATAKRLGARVDAFDTRPVVKEQVESLGAKFLEIDLGETGQTAGGYAVQLTEQQIELQRQGQMEVMKNADIVVTTAQVFGRKAPRIITAEMLSVMKPGAIVVDMAVDSGGNVEGSQPDQEIEIDGVKVIGYRNLPGRVAQNASQMYSNNLINLIFDYWNKDTAQFELKPDEEILKGCVITHGGELVNAVIKNLRAQASKAAAA